MARIRQLKPEFWTDDKIAGLSRDARLLFLGLLTEADDDGRLVDSSKLLAGSLFPFDDDVTPKKLNGWLEEIIRTGRVKRYARGAASYLYIVNFKRHQKIAHPRRSSLPDPDDCPPPAGGTRADDVQAAPDPPAERAPDLGVKGSRGQGVVASAPSAERSEAERIVREWWESKTPRPVAKFIGVVKLIERFLEAGHFAPAVAQALHDAPAQTVGALEFQLNKPTQQRRTTAVERSWRNVLEDTDDAPGSETNPARNGHRLAPTRALEAGA